MQGVIIVYFYVAMHKANWELVQNDFHHQNKHLKILVCVILVIHLFQLVVSQIDPCLVNVLSKVELV